MGKEIVSFLIRALHTWQCMTNVGLTFLRQMLIQECFKTFMENKIKYASKQKKIPVKSMHMRGLVGKAWYEKN